MNITELSFYVLLTDTFLFFQFGDIMIIAAVSILLYVFWCALYTFMLRMYLGVSLLVTVYVYAQFE